MGGSHSILDRRKALLQTAEKRHNQNGSQGMTILFIVLAAIGLLVGPVLTVVGITAMIKWLAIQAMLNKPLPKGSLWDAYLHLGTYLLGMALIWFCGRHLYITIY